MGGVVRRERIVGVGKREVVVRRERMEWWVRGKWWLAGKEGTDGRSD
jgi:hypothetical protein